MAYCLSKYNAHKSIRKEIIENHQLQAVISMPSGVFKPYAGVSTAVLVFTQSYGTEMDRHESRRIQLG